MQVLSVDDLSPALSEHSVEVGAHRIFGIGTGVDEIAAVPRKPGVYVWDTDGAVLYIGSAASLYKRLTDYAKWLAGYKPNERWEVSVIHMLKIHRSTVRWVQTTHHAEAMRLERRLIEWHRASVGIAPLVVGWEAKAGSPRADAERWAQGLWNQVRPDVAPQPASTAAEPT